MRVYIVFYGSDLFEEVDKVICVVVFLIGDIFIWFEFFQRDYFEKGFIDCDFYMKDIFLSYVIFEKKFKVVFRDFDEECIVEQQLYNFCQKGLVLDYVVRFQQISL